MNSVLRRIDVTPVSDPSASTDDVSGVVEHLFRHESGRMVAILTRIFGIEHLGLAEDVVQDTLGRALQTWPYHGIPENPAAWIMRAARNRALDVIRRDRVFQDKEAEVIRQMEDLQSAATPMEAEGTSLADDRLRLMLVCCHPQIPEDAQAALALKTLCGFSVTEISRAFLTSEAAVAKRLTRARQKIREARIPFEIPEGENLEGRVEGVRRTLYLLFNEGYKASQGERLVREEICHEAIRLTTLLAEHPVGRQPATEALLALMMLSAARFPARMDTSGQLLRLNEQDRSRWDATLISRGLFHLMRSAAGDEISEYHLQAGIAACHTAAPDYDSTDWRQILSLYDQLVRLDPSPVVALNRAVVVGNVHGAAAGLAAVEAIPQRRKLDDYYLLYAVLGELESQLGRHAEAVLHFRRSLQLAELRSEQTFLQRRVEDSEGYLDSAELMVPRRSA